MKTQDLRDFVWERIGDKRLVGKGAATVFSGCAIVSILLVVVALLDIRLGRTTMPGFLLIAGVVGALILWTGIERYWARYQGQTGTTSKVWFVVLTFAVFFGPALFYVFVYFPHVRRNWQDE
jgi:hypothetical protein